MFNSSAPAGQGVPNSRFTLQRPVSIAVYNSYQDAQHAVDYLADQRFPVQNLSIVGTDLKSFERITGGLTWGKVLSSAAMTGVSWALMMSIFLWLFIPNVNLLALVLIALVGFVGMNMLVAAIGYRTTGGRRDFTSNIQIIATHYEVLGEAEVANQARTLLSGGVRPSAPAAPAAGQSSSPQPESPAQGTGLNSPLPGNYPPPAWPTGPSAGTGNASGFDPTGGDRR